MMRTEGSTTAPELVSKGPGLLLGACCFVTGAAAMYLFDPSRGRTRRARLLERAASMYTHSAQFADKVERDLQNRAKGAMATVKARVTHEDEVSDQKLEARVRTILGRTASHPHAIHVVAQHGCIRLEGNILAREAGRVLSAVRAVRGVTEVQNRMHIFDEAGEVPGLQGGSERGAPRTEFLQSNWRPAARVMAGALGGGLVLYGMRGKGPVAKAGAATGSDLKRPIE